MLELADAGDLSRMIRVSGCNGPKLLIYHLVYVVALQKAEGIDPRGYYMVSDV